MSKSDITKIEKASILLTQEEIDLIDLWRFENRVGSRAAALRALLGRGCRAYFDSTRSRSSHENDEDSVGRQNNSG